MASPFNYATSRLIIAIDSSQSPECFGLAQHVLIKVLHMQITGTSRVDLIVGIFKKLEIL